MTTTSFPFPPLIARRLAAKEGEFRRLRFGDGSSGIVAYGDWPRAGDLARASAPDRRQGELRGDAAPRDADSPIGETALDAPQAIDS